MNKFQRDCKDLNKALGKIGSQLDSHVLLTAAYAAAIREYEEGELPAVLHIFMLSASAIYTMARIGSDGLGTEARCQQDWIDLVRHLNKQMVAFVTDPIQVVVKE